MVYKMKVPDAWIKASPKTVNIPYLLNLDSAVGEGAANRHDDVMLVQWILLTTLAAPKHCAARLAPGHRQVRCPGCGETGGSRLPEVAEQASTLGREGPPTGGGGDCADTSAEDGGGLKETALTPRYSQPIDACRDRMLDQQPSLSLGGSALRTGPGGQSGQYFLGKPKPQAHFGDTVLCHRLDGHADGPPDGHNSPSDGPLHSPRAQSRARPVDPATTVKAVPPEIGYALPS